MGDGGITGGGGRSARVLVVDDDQDIRELLALTVRQDGWEPVGARTGTEALRAVQDVSPAVALIDYQLPDMTGLELLRLIHAANPELPCIVVTGQGSERVAVEIMKAGAADYLVKPFEPSRIVEVVRTALEERRVRSSRIYRVLAEDLEEKNALLERRMEELARRMAETNALHDSARLLTSQLELPELLGTVLRLAGELFQAPAASIRLLDREGKRLVLAAHAGLGEEYLRRAPVPLGDSAAGRAAVTGQPVHVADAESDGVYLRGAQLRHTGLRSLLCLPLLVRGRCIGVMTLYHRQPRGYLPEEMRFLETFAGTVSIAVDNARLYGEQAHRAVTDGLTGLYNHKHFQEVLVAEFARARRYGHPLSLVLVDIDHFKAYNDSRGHQAGDALLRSLAGIFQSAARQNDLVARYGGEEFAFLLPQSDKRQALALAKRLCRAVERRRGLEEEGRADGKVTISLGVAAYPEDVTEASDLIARADEALYRAKHLGRNRVQAWQRAH